MIIAVINLYQTINEKINELKASGERIQLVKEWNDLFAEVAQNNLVKLWLSLSGKIITQQYYGF